MGDRPKNAESTTKNTRSTGRRSASISVTVTMSLSFHGLEQDSNQNDIDYIFRADVLSRDGTDADACKNQAGGYGVGVDRYVWKVDEDLEVRTGSVSADCPSGNYTVRASLSSADNVELASATAGFTVSNPAEEQPETESSSTDATLSSLELSHITFDFDPATHSYDLSGGNRVTETTITAETNHASASYQVALVIAEGYRDGTVTLAEGANVIYLAVTADNRETTASYTIPVTRAAPPLSTDATLSGLTLSGVRAGNGAGWSDWSNHLTLVNRDN